MTYVKCYIICYVIYDLGYNDSTLFIWIFGGSFFLDPFHVFLFPQPAYCILQVSQEKAHMSPKPSETIRAVNY